MDDASIRDDVLRRVNDHETNQPHVYTQQIGDRKLWFSVAENDPLATLLGEAIEAHSRMRDTLCAARGILLERSETMDRMLGEVMIDAEYVNSLRAYSEALIQRDGPHGGFLSTCVPLIDPKHMTASYRIARSLNAIVRGRQQWLCGSTLSEELSHEEATSQAFRVARNVYTILHSIIDVCSHMCGQRFVHNLTRDTMSSYAQCVTPLIPELVRCSRRCLETADEAELAWMIAAHAHSSMVYLKDVDTRYGVTGSEERHRRTEKDLLELQKDVRDAAYVRDAVACDKRLNDGSLNRLYESTQRSLGHRGVTNTVWLRLFNQMSEHLHKRLSVHTE